MFAANIRLRVKQLTVYPDKFLLILLAEQIPRNVVHARDGVRAASKSSVGILIINCRIKNTPNAENACIRISPRYFCSLLFSCLCRSLIHIRDSGLDIFFPDHNHVVLFLDHLAHGRHLCV